MPRRGISLLTCKVLLLLLCSCGSADRHLHHVRFYAMGTMVEVLLWEPDDEKARTAQELIRRELIAWGQRWDPWLPGSDLNRLNLSLQAPSAVPVGAPLLGLIRSSLDYYHNSQGLFHPALGALVREWGFHEGELTGQFPSAARLEDFVGRLAQLDGVSIEGNLLRGGEGLQFDFGGFAKGYAIDLLLRQLRSQGVENAVLNVGGDLRAIGQRGTRPWNIGIRHPRTQGVVASVSIERDESVFTSGDYERFFIHRGQRYHHILDPRTGWPARGFISVTVIQQQAKTADAAATALFVAGPAQWRQVAGRMGIDQALLIEENGSIHVTERMRRRIKLYSDAESELELAPAQ